MSTRDQSAESARSAAFPIVAIGASAGGLEALRQLFSNLPDDTGMAFVVIQHLAPDRPSLLSDVLTGDTRMPVEEVVEGARVEPNHVYVIPSDADLDIHEGVLSLVPRTESRKLHLPIDSFFRALAENSSGRAIGVVLSGSASDGTDGLKAIKAAGGITFAQAPGSAQFRSMPDSAIAAGVVDFQSSPSEIASELVQLSRDPYLAPSDPAAGAEDAPPAEDDGLRPVLAAIFKHAGLDFRGYKRPTLLRRVARRMALRHLGSVSDYAESLRDDPVEAKALAQDALIHVTSFFRDPGAFEAFKSRVLPELIEHKGEGAALRIWVPGCSTGQEAYSLAMCLIEHLDERHPSPSVKIFGSDLSDQAIETARAGLYSESELEGVSPERVARFFERSDGRFRVGRLIRDLCVFVRQDLTRDPPFAKLDLISCRNVLIYFDSELQTRVLSLLHHCLNVPGYLMLGRSEGIRELEGLFEPIDPESRIYCKAGESPTLAYPLALGWEAESRIPAFQPTLRPQPARDAQRQANHFLLARYAPPGVVVNERLEVVQFCGRTGDYLEPAPGRPQTNVLKMAREWLVTDLREALEAAKAQSVTVRRNGVRIATDPGARSINLEVAPLLGAAAAGERYFLVIFEEPPAAGSAPAGASPAPPRPAHPTAEGPADETIDRLKAELAATRAYLQAITGEHQDTTEQLGAANEELLAANEELQSTNEELQSAKEELQGTNEELTTLNEELHNRNQQLDQVANDLVNVLESVQIPMIMVDHALRVRRFTPTAREVSSLAPGDVGRSLDDVKLKLKVDDLVDRVRRTIESVTPSECEIQRLDGRWFRLHIRPYRTADNRLDGAVLSFLDVDVLKRSVQDAESARDYAQGIVETVPMSLVVLDGDLRVVSANPPFYQAFGPRTSTTANAELFEFAAGALDVPALREAALRSLADRTPFKGLDVRCRVPANGVRELVVAGCPFQSAQGDVMLLLALEDDTERSLLEASEKQSRLEAEQANRAKDLFLATLSHELRTPLNTILMSAHVLQKVGSEDPRVRRASAAIERAVGNQVRLIDDLLDISRIVSGKLMLDLQAVDLAAVVQSAVDVAQTSAEAKGVGLDLALCEGLGPIHGDPARLQQVVANLLNNAIKFTPAGGSISVRVEAVDRKARLTVTDTGMGVRAEVIPHLFDRFVQAESSMTRTHGGLGLGLAIVRHIVDVHGGDVCAESPGPDRGATFTVTLPLASLDRTVEPTVDNTVAISIAGVRVLLIEDDDDTREACASMLEEQGAEVRAARSAADGLAALARFAPQVILCDIAMPGEDGYAFIRKVRSGDAGRRGVPAAAVTALAGEEDRRRALEAGYQMHLAKPITAERLAVAVATLATEPPPAEAPDARP